MATPTEKNLAIIVGETRLTEKQMVFAIRDFLKWLDPKAGLIYVVDADDNELSAYSVDPERYAVLELDEHGRIDVDGEDEVGHSPRRHLGG